MKKFKCPYCGSEDGFDNITCCGKLVETRGLGDAEYLICPECCKSMEDVTGLTFVDNSLLELINPKRVDLSDREHIWRIKDVNKSECKKQGEVMVRVNKKFLTKIVNALYYLCEKVHKGECICNECPLSKFSCSFTDLCSQLQDEE